MTPPASEPVITLKGGTIVPLAVLQQLWLLENNGLRFEVAPDAADILVRPRERLTPEDLAFLREHKALVLRLLTAYSQVTA